MWATSYPDWTFLKYLAHWYGLGMDMKYNYAAEKKLESVLDCVISENS